MITTVLFDLDGTIVDTNELIIETYLHVLEGQTPEPYTRERIIPHMGTPLLEQLRLFTEKEDVEQLAAAYREFNIKMHDELVKEFPHVKEVLSLLREKGFRLGVVTSKMRKTVMMGLKLCGLESLMDVVITLDEVEHPKPHPEPILMALRALGAEPEDAIMVGDSHYDIQSAHNAGVASVGVGWSMKGTDYLKKFDPDYMIDDIRELLPLVGVERDSH